MIRVNTQSQGFTYVELLLALTIGALLVAGLSGVVGQAMQTRDLVHEKNELARQANFAMQRMVQAVSHSGRLLLPLNDNPNTNWPENIREQTLPASAPIGDSTLATAVLAVTLPANSDLDANGTPDADNDADGLINEDLPHDNHFDNAPGIAGIDDDGDGSFDEGGSIFDDDEDGIENEDPLDGIDNDGDGSIDEDTPSDMNADACPGICGVDDDSDGDIDEGGDTGDDDELGSSYEDAYDPVVFYLDNGTLKERMPVPWDANSDSLVTGADFVTSTIAEQVTRFRVERIPQSNLRYQLIDIILELTSPVTGEVISLQAQIRLGGAL